jgi:hypothetical protein
LAVQFRLLPLQFGPLRLIPQFLLLPLLSRLPRLLCLLPLPLVCRGPLPRLISVDLSLSLLGGTPLLFSALPLPFVCRGPLPRLIGVDLALSILGRSPLLLGLLLLPIVLIVGSYDGGRSRDFEDHHQRETEYDSANGLRHGSSPIAMTELPRRRRIPTTGLAQTLILISRVAAAQVAMTTALGR